MRDDQVYRTINETVDRNNTQIGNAFNQLRMEVVTLQAALISEVLRSQSLEEVLLEAVTTSTSVDGATTKFIVTKEAIEARFKTKLEEYEKKIEERKKAQAEAQAAASTPKIVAPTAEEIAKVTHPMAQLVPSANV